MGLLAPLFLAATMLYVTIAGAAQETTSSLNLPEGRDRIFTSFEAATPALVELLKAGAIRRASAADFQRLAKAWHARGVDVALDGDDSFLGHVTYVVLRRVTIPTGMHGGKSAVFLIEAGVETPKDAGSHNSYVSLANGRCVGANVQICYSVMPEAAVAEPLPGVRAIGCGANIWRPGTVKAIPPGPLRLVEVRCGPSSHTFQTTPPEGSNRKASTQLPPNTKSILILHDLQPKGIQCHDCGIQPPPEPHTGPLLERRNAQTGTIEWMLNATATTWWQQDLFAISKSGRFALLLMPPATFDAGSRIALVSLADGKVIQDVLRLSVGSMRPLADFVGDDTAWIAIGNVTLWLRLNEGAVPKARRHSGRARSGKRQNEHAV
ncbi:hypothetical protein FSB78_14840 [Sphingomonas ginsenosidivorax]|uniref:Uncharacterized protein n=1 Tax=Sphingomonas ginsenosidivorax TaxID=862135 RepID=A0A5C6UHA3_9SPHN|nr:hypothetical protein [Sphingomonas ginsenosidivorax]TXC72079.1 hypothetical protein FSB78_14840 [Sphingomonas ginsenosidivorax]